MPLKKIPQHGLVAHYPLTEQGGLSAFEKRGNKMTATLTNGAYFDKTYCRLDGSNDYIDPPKESVFSLASFTLSCKVRFTAVGTNQFFIDCSNDGSYGYGYSIRLTTTNKIRFWAYDANNLIDSPGTYGAGVTYNVTATYNGTTKLQSLYIDGRLVISGTHTNSFVPATVSRLRIGSANLFGGSVNGLLKDVLFYNRALTTNEVEAIYLRSKQTF
jgi:hypothetical protein